MMMCSHQAWLLCTQSFETSACCLYRTPEGSCAKRQTAAMVQPLQRTVNEIAIGPPQDIIKKHEVAGLCCWAAARRQLLHLDS